MLSEIINHVLGSVVIAGASLSRVPQIKKVMEEKSVEGLSISSYEIETMVNMITVMFNYGRPFSAYGESIALVIQYLVLMYLMYQYSGNRDRGIVMGGVFAAVVLLWAAGAIPHFVVASAFSLSVVSLAVARGSQAWANHQNGSTGVLAPATLAVNVAGTAIRIYTNATEVPPPPFSAKLSYYIAFSLNVVLMYQYFTLGPSAPRGPAGPTGPRAGAASREKVTVEETRKSQ